MVAALAAGALDVAGRDRVHDRLVRVATVARSIGSATIVSSVCSTMLRPVQTFVSRRLPARVDDQPVEGLAVVDDALDVVGAAAAEAIASTCSCRVDVSPASRGVARRVANSSSAPRSW